MGAFSAMCFSVYMEDVLTTPVRFALALLIGGIAAGIAGVLIGIPVLRLQGDYLAIVTLAFGEIIKNVLNATYLGIDGSGIHVSLKDAASMTNLREKAIDKLCKTKRVSTETGYSFRYWWKVLGFDITDFTLTASQYDELCKRKSD